MGCIRADGGEQQQGAQRLAEGTAGAGTASRVRDEIDYYYCPVVPLGIRDRAMEENSGLKLCWLSLNLSGANRHAAHK